MIEIIKPFIINAVEIIKSNISLLSLPILLGFIICAPDHFLGKAGIILFPSAIISFLVIYPLIYGKYIELINREAQYPWYQILNKYWFNYVVAHLVLYLPIIAVGYISLLFDFKMSFLMKLLYLVVDVLSIYIIPLVFLRKDIFPSIVLGSKCLLGNLKFNEPLIGIVLLAFLPSIVSELLLKIMSHEIIVFALNFSVYILNVLINFILFIAASLILKDKLFQESI
jgi:hypothetical protein